MTISYAFVKVMQGQEPYLDSSGRMPKEQARFLKHTGNMREKYLGACLDSCRWGSITTIMYDMNIKEMVSFIQNWINQNPKNFQSLWHEHAIEDLYTKFELPFINHKTCPKNKEHTRTIKDLGGKLRCAHKVEINSVPKKQDFCYTILSDIETILSLETILRRLNLNPEFQTVYCGGYPYSIEPCKKLHKLNAEERERYSLFHRCMGHTELTNQIEFPFDGWTLAFYAKKWYEQLPNGQAPLFEKSTRL